MKTEHEVLVEMRNQIDRGTWRQKAMTARGGGGCLWGVACTVAPGEANREAYEAACEVLVPLCEMGEDHPTTWLTVAVWNDESGRTKAEVLALLDRAISLTAPAPQDPFDHGDIERISVQRAPSERITRTVP